ncbi:MAG TPA: metallophosphoesterase [Candidatus Dormibacteraeota bacterium]|jgi:3',5'-cyclic AMP phosphodiesterase CpdA
MTRILAVADEVDEGLYGEKLRDLRPDLVLSAGDLPFDYLEYLVSRLDVPLLYVPGNHDRDLSPGDSTWLPLRTEGPPRGPRGCVNADGRIIDAAGLRIAGLGGSHRYRQGANQYSQVDMRWRALALEAQSRVKYALDGRATDILLTHAPPAGVGDAADKAHQGFEAFHRLVRVLSARLLVHGHIHPYGGRQADRQLGNTSVVNAVPSRLLEL